MLDLVRTELGIEHVLAARRLYVVGAQLLWEVSTEDDVRGGPAHCPRPRRAARRAVHVPAGHRALPAADHLRRRVRPAPGAAALRGRPHRHRPRGSTSANPTSPTAALLSRLSVTCCGPVRPSRTLRTTSASRSTRSPSSPSARGCSRCDRPAARPRAGAGVQVARRRWSAAVLREVGRSVDGRRAATKGHVRTYVRVGWGRAHRVAHHRSPPARAGGRRAVGRGGVGGGRRAGVAPDRVRGRGTAAGPGHGRHGGRPGAARHIWRPRLQVDGRGRCATCWAGSASRRVAGSPSPST